MRKMLLGFLLSVAVIPAHVHAFGFGDSGLCLAHIPKQARKCSGGDIMLYQPRMFGNQQLPIIVAAAFCDFEHPIVYNAGGVSCVFTDDRKGAWKKLLGE